MGGFDPVDAISGQADKLFEGLFGGSSQAQSSQQINTFQPTETATNISNMLQSIFGGTGNIPGQIQGQIGQQPNIPGAPGREGGFDLGGFQQGAIGQQLQSELTSPSFGPQGASEQALIESLKSQTGGASALRGLGPATGSAIGQAIAPTLVGLRQNRIANLLGGAGLEAQTGLGARGQDLSSLLGQFQGGIQQRGQDIGVGQFGAGLQEQGRTTNLQALLQQLGLGTQGLGLAAGLMDPTRIVTGQSSSTGGTPGMFSQLFPKGFSD